tara:strand:- start:1329 stop:2069 length:741 start_codon:yes stop_codon:yes gene_type:complete
MGNQVSSSQIVERSAVDVINDTYCLNRFKNIIGPKVNEERYTEMLNTFSEYLNTYNNTEDYPNSVEMLDKLIKSVYFTHIMYQIPSDLAIFVFMAFGSNFDDYLNIIFTKTFAEIRDLLIFIKNTNTDIDVLKKRLHFLTKFKVYTTNVNPTYHVWKCMNGINRLGYDVYFDKRSNSTEKDQQDIAEIERINNILISWIDGKNYTNDDCENLMINITNNHISDRSYQYIVACNLLDELHDGEKLPE